MKNLRLTLCSQCPSVARTPNSWTSPTTNSEQRVVSMTLCDLLKKQKRGTALFTSKVRISCPHMSTVHLTISRDVLVSPNPKPLAFKAQRVPCLPSSPGPGRCCQTVTPSSPRRGETGLRNTVTRSGAGTPGSPPWSSQRPPCSQAWKKTTGRIVKEGPR